MSENNLSMNHLQKVLSASVVGTWWKLKAVQTCAKTVRSRLVTCVVRRSTRSQERVVSVSGSAGSTITVGSITRLMSKAKMRAICGVIVGIGPLQSLKLFCSQWPASLLCFSIHFSSRSNSYTTISGSAVVNMTAVKSGARFFSYHSYLHSEVSWLDWCLDYSLDFVTGLQSFIPLLLPASIWKLHLTASSD